MKNIVRKFKNIIIRILTPICPKLETKIAYKCSFNKKLNFREPKTINEKILYLKLNQYYNNDLVTKCADKYQIREFLEKQKMEEILPNLYGVYEKVEDIQWENFPESFVVKCNHGCGYNIIVPNRNDFDLEDAKNKLKRWMKEDYWKHGEVQYRFIKKRIIVEEYL